MASSESPPRDSPPMDSDSPGTSTPKNYIQFTPKRAMQSFDNLVALANHQERLKEARKMVWRDRGQPVVELNDLRACLEHALRGGIRAGTLGFAIRACFNLVLALIRMRRTSRDVWFALVKRAVFGTDTFRFAGMLGTFASVYKLILNSLPFLITPSPTYFDSPIAEKGRDLEAGTPETTIVVPLAQRRARLSLSAQAQLILVRKKTRRWHAVLAGAAAGGLAIMFETRGRRVVISQQLFVRGLQGSYNAYSTRRNIKIPHGDVLVFSLACAQIMYAFLMRPDTLPRSYNVWIGQASKLPREAFILNHDIVRHRKFNLEPLENLIARKDTHPANKSYLLNLRSLVTAPTPSYGPSYAPCEVIHPALDSCLVVAPDRFFTVFKWMLPIYGALHFIPAVLLKWRAFLRDPTKMLLRAGWGTARSSAFLGVFVTIFQGVWCGKNNLYEYLSSRKPPFRLPQGIIDIILSKQVAWFGGILSGLSLFVEEKRRRGELAMYVLPKGLESAWVMARGKGLVFKTGKWGETILSAIAMGMVMVRLLMLNIFFEELTAPIMLQSTYQNDPQHLSGLVRRMLYQFIGPN